jgi:hypothetical protein
LAKKSKRKPAKNPRNDNTAALQLHTRALNRHAKVLENLLASNDVPGRAAAALAAGRRHFTKTQIKQVIADVTGNPIGSLNDNLPVSGMLSGGGGIGDDIVGQINERFGPPPLTLTYDRVSGLKIGELVNLIYGSL